MKSLNKIYIFYAIKCKLFPVNCERINGGVIDPQRYYIDFDLVMLLYACFMCCFSLSLCATTIIIFLLVVCIGNVGEPKNERKERINKIKR